MGLTNRQKEILQKVSEKLPANSRVFVNEHKMMTDSRWYEIRTQDRIYSLVENGLEYEYTREMAARLAVWAKARKAEGKSMLFREFYDTLDYYDKQTIHIERPDEWGKSFKNSLTWEKHGFTKLRGKVGK